MMKLPMRQYGFTLIEMIITMVIVSILAVGSVQFIRFSALGFIQTVERSHHGANASVITEKIMRHLRQALPNSVRITSDNRCVEFIPIIGASEYVQAPTLGSPNPDTQLHIVPLAQGVAQNRYAAIYPLATGSDLYNNARNPGMITTNPVEYNGPLNGASVYDLVGGFRFQQGSPTQRVYLVSQPNSFCQQGNHIYWYGQYGFVGNITNLSGALASSVPNRLIIGTGLKDNSLVFDLNNGAVKRASLLSISFELQHDNSNESLVVNQEVQIRNVP